MTEIEKKKEDVLTTTSDLPGLAGVAEKVLRRFRNLTFVVILSPLALLCCACVGIAATPGIALFDFIRLATINWNPVGHYLSMGLALGVGYLLYGLSLIVVVPFFNWIIPWKVKPFRGPWYSLPAVPWYIHNALTYVARITFLDFLAPSPLLNIFYRMMGMKIGRGVVINTTNISDPCLITLDDFVTVGGSATIFAHYGQKGYLIIAPVHIGKGTNIGLKSSIMGGVTVGSNCNIKPHVVLLPKTIIGDNENI